MTLIEYVHNAEPDGGEGLVATIVRSGYKSPNGVAFLTGREQPLQVAKMSRRQGEDVEPHVHHERKRVVTQTQEVLIVERGLVLVGFYTGDGRRFDNRTLGPGDVCVLHCNGHSLHFLEDTDLLEVKQGPYAGRELDKRTL